ncbi:MBL fold metallo-hydrolase, partial [Candidatus Parcubacteria bacterium]
LVIIVVLCFRLKYGFYQKNSVEVWVFDIGQGDAIFIRGPERKILIDGGPDNTILEKLGQVLLYWDRDFDFLINTHAHSDHLFGLAVVSDRYDIGNFLYNGLGYNSGLLAHVENLNNLKKVSYGDVIDLGGGAILSVLWPDANYANYNLPWEQNNMSVITLLEYQGVKIMFTGDAGIEVENSLAPVDDIDILKVSHHGSDSATSMKFLENVNPEVGVISVGRDNKYGLPDIGTINRLKLNDVEILRTDQIGDVKIVIKNGTYFIKTFLN